MYPLFFFLKSFSSTIESRKSKKKIECARAATDSNCGDPIKFLGTAAMLDNKTLCSRQGNSLLDGNKPEKMQQLAIRNQASRVYSGRRLTDLKGRGCCFLFFILSFEPNECKKMPTASYKVGPPRKRCCCRGTQKRKCFLWESSAGDPNNDGGSWGGDTYRLI